MHFGTILPFIHIFRHHLSFHHITPWIKWLLFIFPKIRTRPGPWIFFLFLQDGIPTHPTFISKKFFWDGFCSPLSLFKPKRFSKWILLIVSISFSYYIRSQPPWIAQVFGTAYILAMIKISSGIHPYNGGNIISTHESCFMPLIPQRFCDTFLLTPIWNCNHGRLWNHKSSHLAWEPIQKILLEMYYLL